MRVMIIDDEIRLARAIDDVLHTFDGVAIESRIALSYATAREAILTFVPDFAIVDVSAMSIDYHFDLARLEALFAVVPSCRIVLASAQDDPPAGYEIGPDRLWLPKPFGRVAIATALGISLATD